MAVPRDDVLLDPCWIPFAMTIPSGAPSGVKNPALMAAIPLFAFAADCESGQMEPGPFGWSATMRFWFLVSKVTMLN